MCALEKRDRGFTLVELIVIIVLGGLLGALIVHVLGAQLLQSKTPLSSANDAAQAETILEDVQSFFMQNVNNGTSGALDQVYSHYGSGTNSTITFTRNASTFGSDGVDSLTVVVTVGRVSYATLLTQERTNPADTAVAF